MILFFLSILLIGWVCWFGEKQRIATITPLEQPNEAQDFNKTSTTLVIDDYSTFVDACLQEQVKQYKPPKNSPKQRINLQEIRHKEKVLQKRRIQNRIAKKSRQQNQKN